MVVWTALGWFDVYKYMLELGCDRVHEYKCFLYMHVCDLFPLFATVDYNMTFIFAGCGYHGALCVCPPCLCDTGRLEDHSE